MQSFPPTLGALAAALLAAWMGLLGVSLGKRLLNLFRLPMTHWAESVALAGGLGLGALAYGFLLLGLVGLLRLWSVAAVLAVATVLAWPEIRRWQFSSRLARLVGRRASMFERVGLTLILGMVAVVFIRGLAPVTDYDGLMYHLVVPRDFLKAGRIFATPGEAHPNFPLTVDLLYVPAVAAGVENAARLIHLGFGLLVGIGTYALSRRLIGSHRGALLGTFVLATTPVLGTVAGYAHTDLGWVLFELLAVYALVGWVEGGGDRWLILSGLFAGIGLGSKYLGLPFLGVLGAAVLLHSVLVARRPLGRALVDGLLLGFPAVIVASPWYIKNWIALGNPVYPLWFGGLGWDKYLADNLQFMGTHYGPRQGLAGYLMLPLDIYRYSIGHFGPIPFAFPTPLSLLLPLYLFAKKRWTISLLLLISLLRFATWAVSARNLRYLMDIAPLLAIVVAYVLVEVGRRAWIRTASQILVLVLMVANLAWQVLLLVQEDPIPVVVGAEGREHYLREHNQPPYRCIEYINELNPDSRVLFVGNGQSYYATAEVVADVDHGNWGHLVYLWGEDLDQIRAALAADGISHIYYSPYDLAWRLSFDTEGEKRREMELFELFAAGCASPVHDLGEDGVVYELLDRCRP